MSLVIFLETLSEFIQLEFLRYRISKKYDKRILDFLSLRNLANNELFFISFVSLQQPIFYVFIL